MGDVLKIRHTNGMRIETNDDGGLTIAARGIGYMKQIGGWRAASDEFRRIGCRGIIREGKGCERTIGIATRYHTEWWCTEHENQRHGE